MVDEDVDVLNDVMSFASGIASTEINLTETLTTATYLPSVNVVMYKSGIYFRRSEHLSSCSVVVQVHQRSLVLLHLFRVEEQPGKCESVFDVGAAPSPLPLGRKRVGRVSLGLVAAAGHDGSLAARLGYYVRHTS